MKKLAILLSLVTVVTVLLGGAASASAATNTDVINTLTAGKVDLVYITKAQNFLNSTSLTAAQLDTINADAQKVIDLMKASGTTDVTKLSKTDKNTVMSYIKDAATAANLTVTFAKDSNGLSYASVKDSSGAEVFRVNADENGLKVTGVNYPVMIYAGLFLILAAGLAGLGLRKRALVTA